MKVSVVIPTYNEEEYIGACLDSLMNQKEKPDEIIVVNNNSTDHTIEIAKRYPVLVISEKKQGMIPTRNRGFNEAKYDIIARTDADTILHPNWINRIKKGFITKDTIALAGPGHFYDHYSDPSASQWRIKTAVKVHNSYLRLVKGILKHDCLYGPNYALRKSAWEQLKNEVCLNDKDVHEDIDLSIHLAPHGKIKFDRYLIATTSLRRWKNVDPYFDYPYRVLKSIQKHKQIVLKTKGKQLVKRIVAKANAMY